jgi:F-type H+-transporting ATPase subunit delta
MASKVKATRHLARTLFRLSVVNGAISDERVGGVLEYIRKEKVSSKPALLRAYHRLVAAEAAKSVAAVEHAGGLAAGALASISAAMTKKYGRPVSATARANPALIAGLRVRVGDDTYESSVAAQLEALASAV